MPTVPQQRPSCLLLLPPPPSPPSYEALKAAYHATLFSVLVERARAADRSSPSPEVLEIALPCDHLYQSRQDRVPRSVTFQQTQRLVAGVYKLICVISAKAGIPLDSEGGIDARILLLAHPRSGRAEPRRPENTEVGNVGPVIDLHVLASCKRAWQVIYHVETKEGQQVVNEFRSVRGNSYNYTCIRGGIVVTSADSTSARLEDDSKAARMHFSVAVGGTFDHLHIGHKLLLTMTAYALDESDGQSSSSSSRLTIGITNDELLMNKKFAELLQSWEERALRVDEFMRSILYFPMSDASQVQMRERKDMGVNGHAIEVTIPSGPRIDYVEISDPFGPTITDDSISVLVISAETRSGGSAVNSKRQEKNWSILEVLEVDVLDADEESEQGSGTDDSVQQAFQNKLSSTEIRRSLVEKTRVRSKA